MFAPEIARQLRRRGHDVIAAIERADLAPLRDPGLFAAAQADQRAVVTENIPDFLDLDRLCRDEARAHYGLILTTDRRFSRDSERHVGLLVLALDAFLRTQPAEPQADGLINWLR